ncbi:MAG TPA: RDD family protein [Trebonia sp.]|nr:RDD family protein [Trebonia sp.]
MEQIVTGEAVILDLPFARFPTRILARLIDMLIEFVAFFVFLLLLGVAIAAHALDGAAVAAVSIAGSVLIIVGYPLACETLGRGRTVGKIALGLRVVADDGGPERFRQALVRALAGVVECWALFGVPALITSMLSTRGKRLGDVFAGTFVVRERAPKAAAPYAFAGGAYPRAAVIHPSLQSWAASLDLSALPEQLTTSAASYLSRFWQLNEAAREQIGRQLAADVAARLSPPVPVDVTPADFLYTVLAERGNRQLARAMPPGGPAQGAPVLGGPVLGGPVLGGPVQAGPPQAGPTQGGWAPTPPPTPPSPAAPGYPPNPQDTVFTPPT